MSTIKKQGIIFGFLEIQLQKNAIKEVFEDMSYRNFFRYFYVPKPEWYQRFSQLPDLTFKTYDIDVGGTEVMIKVTITNIGRSKSNQTFVYFNAIDTTPAPGLNEIRIQQVKNLPGLKPREDYDCKFKLTRQEIIDNQNTCTLF